MDQNTPAKSSSQNNVPAVKQTRGVQQSVDTINLRDMFYMLLNNWKLLVLSALLGAIVLGVYHRVFVKPSFRAYTEMYITSSDSLISLADLQLGTALAEDYQAIIRSRAVLNKVIEDLQLNTNYKGLRNLISVSNAAGTHIIRTTVTTSNLELSRDIANDLLLVSIERIDQVVGSGEPMVIDYSEAEAVEDVTPGIFGYMMRGAAALAFIVAGLLFFKAMLDTTIKSDDDVEKYLQLPVLSAIPYFNE